MYVDNFYCSFVGLLFCFVMFVLALVIGYGHLKVVLIILALVLYFVNINLFICQTYKTCIIVNKM